jgi:hypothetical protein
MQGPREWRANKKVQKPSLSRLCQEFDPARTRNSFARQVAHINNTATFRCCPQPHPNFAVRSPRIFAAISADSEIAKKHHPEGQLRFGRDRRLQR